MQAGYTCMVLTPRLGSNDAMVAKRHDALSSALGTVELHHAITTCFRTDLDGSRDGPDHTFTR